MHNFSHEGCAFFLIQIKILGHEDEKTAIITGSSRGLGAKIAITLLEKATMLLLITNKIRIKLKN